MKKPVTLLVTAAALVTGCGARSALRAPNSETPAVAYAMNRSTGPVSVIDTGRHKVTVGDGAPCGIAVDAL